ncbi:hypothetical protein [Teredinibacter haidensis]|uniref:hypothetical protein n=1 Tax=Teredinibacter haidensis TaxID=2731755 RepID=UPI000948BA88|nr:hypothetical protein [Teredinibacter haidensis]
MHMSLIKGVLLVFFIPVCFAQAERLYPVEYRVQFAPNESLAYVTLTLRNSGLVNYINFNLAKSLCDDFESKSSLTREGERIIWRPEGKKAVLHYRCKINQLRSHNNGQKSYDAYMTSDWAIFRGDDLVPPAKVRAKKGASSDARLIFDLPNGWGSVNTGWRRIKNKNEFVIQNPQRNFDRPTGWMIAGKIGTRRAYLEAGKKELSRISVSAPLNSSLRRMDILTFTQMVWPQFERAFITMPKSILVVGADDPFWRGGLSAGNSLYVHADRPIVSENGTSTLLHELVHMVTGIHGQKNNDWIAEGLAEYYGIELLLRSGGMNEKRHKKILQELKLRTKGVKSLRVGYANGAVTAAAVLLFADLSREIRTSSNQRYSLDDLVQRLMSLDRRVSDKDLKAIFEQLTGDSTKVLQTKLLK